MTRSVTPGSFEGACREPGLRPEVTRLVDCHSGPDFYDERLRLIMPEVTRSIDCHLGFGFASHLHGWIPEMTESIDGYLGRPHRTDYHRALRRRRLDQSIATSGFVCEDRSGITGYPEVADLRGARGE